MGTLAESSESGTKEWVVKYDAYAYDSDALAHFISGDIYIPLNSA